MCENANLPNCWSRRGEDAAELVEGLAGFAVFDVVFEFVKLAAELVLGAVLETVEFGSSAISGINRLNELGHETLGDSETLTRIQQYEMAFLDASQRTRTH